MGFRLSRSFKVAPGIRLNVSSRGVGVSAGVRGARVSVSPGGRVTRTLSIPGTGLSHTTTSSGGSRSTRARRPVPPPAPRPPVPPKPGLLAPAAEKEFFRALTGGGPTVDLDAWVPHAFSHVASSHRDERLALLCAALEGLWHFTRCDLDDRTALDSSSTPTATDVPDAGRARHLLGWVVARQARNPSVRVAGHPFVAKYLTGRTWAVEITHGVSANLGLDDDVVNLAAAELHQLAGDVATATWTVENCVDPGTPAALSLAELYSEAERHEDVRRLTDAVTDVDDATALLLVFRARAFARTGWYDAARECLKAAMRSRSRAKAVRHRALLERAEVNLATNRRAAARKDLETVLAEDSTYPGLAEALSSLPPR